MLIFRETHCLNSENKTSAYFIEKEMISRGKGSGDSDWSPRNVQRLLSGLKRSLSVEHRTCSYVAGMKVIQWENVAFPPFSAEACQQKWGEILQKIRKTRSLTELINEAEETLSDPNNQKHMKDKQPLEDNRKTQVCGQRHQKSGSRKRWKKDKLSVSNSEDKQNSEDLLLVKPPSTGYNLFCKEQVKHIKGVPKISYCIVLAERWKALTENQRKKYCARCKELKRQYTNDLNRCLLMEEKQTIDQSNTRKGLNLQEKKEYLSQNPTKHQYLNALNTAVHKEFTPMASDSEDEDIADDISNEELNFDSRESEEEEGENKDMPFMF